MSAWRDRVGDLTLFEAPTGGAFDRLNWRHSGEFDQNFSQKSNAWGFARGGGAWAVLELTGTLCSIPPRRNYAEKASYACLSCRPMIPCGRHPVMPCNGGYVSDVSKCCTQTESFTFPVVIWSKYIDFEVVKCSIPSNGNVSRLYARLSTPSSGLGDESRPGFW